jgi:hypothetical protein
MKTGLGPIVLLGLLFLPWNYADGSDLTAKYYPLKPGITWTYKVTSDKHDTRKIVVTNLAAKEIKDLSLTPRKWDTGGAVKYVLIGSDDKGVYRYGEQPSETAEPVPTTPRVYYLHDPLNTGTTWDIKVKLGEDNLTVNLTIDSVSEKVTVPAGTYKDCLKIKHAGGSQKDGASISLEAYEWYAPDVGLVKSIATITKVGKDKAKTAEHLNYQLESFKR